MANNYYEATGVLALDKVTPVIQALFGVFNLDAAYPGNGKVYIGKEAEGNDTHWDAVNETMAELATELNLSLPADDEVGTKQYLQLLAEHFGVANHERIVAILERDEEDFEDDAELDDLFALARAFDDGHGLKSIKWEGAWTCSQPRLFEFGGNGEYYGRHCHVFSNSSSALTVGKELDEALDHNGLEEAAQLILDSVNNRLAGIHDDAHRSNIRKILGAMLSGPSL